MSGIVMREDRVNAPLRWRDIGKEGGFTTGDAGRLLQRRPAEISSWLRGKPPIIASDYDQLNGRPILSFDALIEARAIAHFIDEGFRPSKLRRIMEEFRGRHKEKHPLARDKSFVTDGFRLFEQDGDRLINLANDVYAEPNLMKPALKGHVVFEHGKAAFFEPEPVEAPSVRIDPRYAFGKPIVLERGRAVRTSALAEVAEDEGVEAAADWFGVSTSLAAQAMHYERLHAA